MKARTGSDRHLPHEHESGRRRLGHFKLLDLTFELLYALRQGIGLTLQLLDRLIIRSWLRRLAGCRFASSAQIARQLDKLENHKHQEESAHYWPCVTCAKLFVRPQS